MTRVAVGGSIALAAAFSAVAAVAFAGRSSAGASAPSTGGATGTPVSTRPLVALPPTKDGSLPQPVQPPVVTRVQPPVTSGGS